MFFAVGYNPKHPKWWGNTVSTSGVDDSRTGFLSIPTRGYFGLDKGKFHDGYTRQMTIGRYKRDCPGSANDFEWKLSHVLRKYDATLPNPAAVSCS
jgi:hypothetical protein